MVWDVNVTEWNVLLRYDIRNGNVDGGQLFCLCDEFGN
ncbi:hypothetical protein DP61_1139 [Burkholderia pseudomallei]|nr:hypothetical protein DP61_1139 [Burkholderia pseudomallei]